MHKNIAKDSSSALHFVRIAIYSFYVLENYVLLRIDFYEAEDIIKLIEIQVMIGLGQNRVISDVEESAGR